MNLHEYKRNALLLSLAMLGSCGVQLRTPSRDTVIAD
jgi:hypothetical protein